MAGGGVRTEDPWRNLITERAVATRAATVDERTQPSIYHCRYSCVTPTAHLLDKRDSAIREEVPVAVAVAPKLGQDRDAAKRRGQPEEVAHRLPLRRVEPHVPLRGPLREALVDGRLVFHRVRVAVQRDVDAL